MINLAYDHKSIDDFRGSRKKRFTCDVLGSPRLCRIHCIIHFSFIGFCNIDDICTCPHIGDRYFDFYFKTNYRERVLEEKRKLRMHMKGSQSTRRPNNK